MITLDVYTYTAHANVLMLMHCNLMIMYFYSKSVIYLPECNYDKAILSTHQTHKVEVMERTQ